jgi:hypothetical protein
MLGQGEKEKRRGGEEEKRRRRRGEHLSLSPSPLLFFPSPRL